MQNPLTESRFSMTRRSFLKMAAGAAAGTALFRIPVIGEAASEQAVKQRHIRPVPFRSLPFPAEEAAENSELVREAYNGVLAMVNTIEDTSLRNYVLSAIHDPTPTFMQEYTSGSAVRRLYGCLRDQGLIDPSKISENQMLPPFSGRSSQAFLTAPGSGYGVSHHAYPGGLCTHVGTNLHITNYICRTYSEVFLYQVHRDTAIAGQALHDIEKPFVFQWQEDGSSLPEYMIAGQGAHHVISLAEVIYRGFPPDEIVAQACAHGAPTSAKEEGEVVGWLKAASLMAGKDPVKYGLLNGSGTGLPAPHRQEGYIVHLGDHDWVLSVPAAQKSVAVLKKIAEEDYGMDSKAADSSVFHAFRNYIGAQVSLMYLNFLAAEPDGAEQVRKLVHRIVTL